MCREGRCLVLVANRDAARACPPPASSSFLHKESLLDLHNTHNRPLPAQNCAYTRTLTSRGPHRLLLCEALLCDHTQSQTTSEAKHHSCPLLLHPRLPRTTRASTSCLLHVRSYSHLTRRILIPRLDSNTTDQLPPCAPHYSLPCRIR